MLFVLVIFITNQGLQAAHIHEMDSHHLDHSCEICIQAQGNTPLGSHHLPSLFEATDVTEIISAKSNSLIVKALPPAYQTRAPPGFTPVN